MDETRQEQRLRYQDEIRALIVEREMWGSVTKTVGYSVSVHISAIANAKLCLKEIYSTIQKMKDEHLA